MVFVDLKKYIAEQLAEITDRVYTFSDERQLDSDDMDNEVVIKQLSGNVYDESATIPYQIDITTTDPEGVMEEFTKLALQCNNKPFTSIVPSEGNEYQSYTLTPFFNTPVIMEPDIRIGSNAYSRIVVFLSMNVIYQISEIEEIKIDSEVLSTENRTLAYVPELASNRISGEELNKSKKRVASCMLSFLMINKAGVFNNKVFQIMTGQLPGNTPFSVQLKMTNGLTATLTMMLGSTNLTSAKMQLPSIQVSLYLYDNRGDNNA